MLLFLLNLFCHPPLEPFCQDGFSKATAQDFFKKLQDFLKEIIFYYHWSYSHPYLRLFSFDAGEEKCISSGLW